MIKHGLCMNDREKQPEPEHEKIQEQLLKIKDEYEKLKGNRQIDVVVFRHYPPEAAQFLRFVALHHYDDGWRFNAVQQLTETDMLTQSDIALILSKKNDAEITVHEP